MTAGAIRLRCEQRAGRNAVTVLACAGLGRAALLPPAEDGAASVMLALLGPGLLAGDAFTLDGMLDAGTALVAAEQMATYAFPGAGAATTHARWTVAAGAALRVVMQPLVPLAGSRVEATTAVDVAGDGFVVLADTLAPAPGASLRARTRVTLDSRLVVRDDLELGASAGGDGAYGTVYAIAADPALRARARDLAAAALAADGAVRGGCGETAGATVVRLAGDTFAVARAAAQIAALLAYVPE